MYCPQCGYENPEDAKFCIGCRYEYRQPATLAPPPVIEPEPVEPHSGSQKWKCVICGEFVDDDFDACWNCQSGRSADCELVMAPRDDREQQLEDREARAERIRRMQGPSANPLGGCLWCVLGIMVCMVIAIIVASVGYGLAGYAILFGGGGTLVAFGVKNFRAMPRHQKVLALASVVGAFSLFMISYAVFNPLFAFIPFLGFALAAFLWWLGVRIARNEIKDEDA